MAKEKTATRTSQNHTPGLVVPGVYVKRSDISGFFSTATSGKPLVSLPEKLGSVYYMEYYGKSLNFRGHLYVNIYIYIYIHVWT